MQIWEFWMSVRAGKCLGCGEEVVFPGTFPRRTFHIGGRWVMYGTVTVHTKRAHIKSDHVLLFPF